MEFLNAQFKYIGQQWGSMSASQKAALGLLVVVVLGGMYGLIHWGGQGDWLPLLDQSFTAEQIQHVQAELAVAGVKSRVEGDRVLIQGTDDDRQQLTAVLAQRGALPRDTSLGYSALVRDDNVFESDQKAGWKQLRGLETELSQVLRRFRGVKDAYVFVEVPKNRTFGARESASRASVHVTLQEGETLDKHRVIAIASFVTGAVRGLTPQNVSITDGSKYYRPPDVDEAMPTELLDLQRQQEEHHAQKVYDQLRYIPGVLVNVHATLRSSDEQTQERKYGKTEVDKETSETESMTSPSAAASPGVRPNTGRALTDAGVGATSTRERTETSMNGLRDLTDKTVVKPKGFVERLTASVNVPRSYMLRIVQSQGGTDTSQTAVDKVAVEELPKIREIVKPLINATADEQVVVSLYHDISPESQPATQHAGQPAFLAIAKDYGPYAGLTVLVLFSLYMVFRIAKKAQAAMSGTGAAGATGGLWGRSASMPTTALQPPLEAISGGPVPVGEAQGMEGILVGHEVDERTVRTQQLVRQISQMVGEDPTASASIIDGWLQPKE